MVDNFEQIKPLMDFSEEGFFYWIQIIQRRKENPKLHKNSHTIKSYCIHSMNELLVIEDEIRSLCMIFQARAMVHLRRRSNLMITHRLNKQIAGMLESGESKSINKQFDKICGKTPYSFDKIWMVDLDFDDYDLDPNAIIAELTVAINAAGNPHDTIIDTIKSKNGIHLITKPFNVMAFDRDSFFSKSIIKKNSGTNLFIPAPIITIPPTFGEVEIALYRNNN